MAKKTLFTKALSKTEFQELRKVRQDPFYFAKFIKVIHPLKGKIPFDLFPFQIKVLWYFLTRRFNIILKFRQAGITELISMFCLWFAMYHSEKNIIIISIKDRVAKKVLRRIKYMYRNLPDHLKVPIINGKGEDLGTAMEIEFANGSMITSIPTTEDAGRSEAVSLAVIDEAAIIRWANQIWAALFPTLSTGGNAIVNSTPYGTGNWFHKMWVDACTDGGRHPDKFLPIRLKWWMHPERDMDWYTSMRSALGERRTAQEIDGDFLSSGNNVFDLADIRAIEESLEDYPPIKVEENGSLLIFSTPKSGSRYCIGSDVSTGRARDYSSFTMYNEKGEEIMVFKKKVSPSRLADILMEKGKKYNNALLAPEGNDIGLSTVDKIDLSGYPNLYYSKALVRKKGEKQKREQEFPGWLTTKKNRPIIIEDLAQDIRDANIIVKDPFFVQEAYTFIYDESNKPIAMGKNRKTRTDADTELSDETFNDDDIMGKAIANHVRKIKPNRGIILPAV